MSMRKRIEKLETDSIGHTETPYEEGLRLLRGPKPAKEELAKFLEHVCSLPKLTLEEEIAQCTEALESIDENTDDFVDKRYRETCVYRLKELGQYTE